MFDVILAFQGGMTTFLGECSLGIYYYFYGRWFICSPLDERSMECGGLRNMFLGNPTFKGWL